MPVIETLGGALFCDAWLDEVKDAVFHAQYLLDEIDYEHFIFPKLLRLCLTYCHNLQTISQGRTHNDLKDLQIIG